MFLSILALISAIAAIILYIIMSFEKIYAILVLFIICFSVLFILWLAVGIILSFFVDTKKECKKSEWIFHFYVFSVASVAKSVLNIRLHISGLDILPNKNFLLVCNHKSALDPLLEMGCLSKYNFGFVAKKELFRIPVIGNLMHKSFCLPIDRGNPRSEVHTIVQAINIIKSGCASIGIYPEGTRNPGDGLLPFKAGAFKIAQKAECPIVVVVINNSEMVRNNAPFKRTDIYLDFTGVLDENYVKQNSTIELSETVRNMMKIKLNEKQNTNIKT